jgi:hypothetical protein
MQLLLSLTKSTYDKFCLINVIFSDEMTELPLIIEESATRWSQFTLLEKLLKPGLMKVSHLMGQMEWHFLI